MTEVVSLLLAWSVQEFDQTVTLTVAQFTRLFLRVCLQ